MKIEERDFYKDIVRSEDFPLDGSPSPQDHPLPTIPGSYRIREVEVVLSGAPMDKFFAVLQAETKKAWDRRVLLSGYDVHLQCWVNEEGG